jgi:hypothetical protein
MGAKVHVVDDGGTLAVTGWRIRGVAGETRTAIRLLEVKRARSRREHLLLGRVARQLRSTPAKRAKMARKVACQDVAAGDG